MLPPSFVPYTMYAHMHRNVYGHLSAAMGDVPKAGQMMDTFTIDS